MNIKSVKKIAACYIRVSTDEQAEKGTSLKVQRESLEKFCQTHEYKIYKVYEDDGYSGASFERPGLKQLLEDAKNGRFHIVVVLKTDRMSRSIKNIVNLVLDDFNQIGIAFQSVTEPFDTSTPVGQMLFVLLASFAEFERSTIRDRSRSGKLSRAKEGKWMAGLLPFGYQKDENKFLIPEPEEKQIYESMVEYCLQGYGTLTIARKLNERGVITKHTKVSRHKKVFKWKSGTVLGILRSPIYIGESSFRGYKIKVPQLISKEKWNLVQAQISKNYNNAARNTVRFYMLRGLLYCKKCGRRLFGCIKPSRGMRVYSCLSKRCDPDPRSCGLRSVNLDKINTFIWNITSELVKNSDKLMEAIKEKSGELNVGNVISEVELKRAKAAIEEKDKEINRTLELYGKTESFSIDELDKRVQELKEAKNNLHNDVDEILQESTKARIVKENLSQIEDLMGKVRDRIDNFSEQEKFDFLHLLVHKITVDYDEDRKIHLLEIEGAIPIFDSLSIERIKGDNIIHQLQQDVGCCSCWRRKDPKARGSQHFT